MDNKQTRAYSETSLMEAKLEAALELICATPGYERAGGDLARLAAKGKICSRPSLEDRAQAGLLGTILIGPEAAGSSPLSLAQTLVHEYFHLKQNPLLKTVSFWSGVVTRTAVMKRYEQPAYQAALDFLERLKQAHPHLAEDAAAEQTAIRQVFENSFGGSLLSRR